MKRVKPCVYLGCVYARQREEQVCRPRDETQLGMSEAQYRGWRVNHTVGGNEAGGNWGEIQPYLKLFIYQKKIYSKYHKVSTLVQISVYFILYI